MQWAMHVACMGTGGEHRGLPRKPEGKGPLKNTQHVWDNIKIDHQEVGWGNGLDSSPSGNRQLAGTCKCCNEPSGSTKCGVFLDRLRIVSLKRTLLYGVP